MTSRISKIQPYFYALTPKSRLIVYLISTGKYTLDEIRHLTAEGLSRIKKKIPEGLELGDYCNYLIDSFDDDDEVFRNNSGRPLSITDLTNILKRSHKNAGVEYKGFKEFVASV